MKTRIIIMTTVVTALAALVSQAEAVIVYSTDLTSATFTNGSIEGQDGWDTNNNSYVITTGTGAATNGFDFAVNSAASTVAQGITYTSSATFQYSDTSGGVGGGPHIGTSLWNSSDASSGEQISALVRRTDTSYRLTLATNWGNAFPDNIGFNQTGVFAATSIGITHGSDSLTDVLRLDLAATAGATVDDWDVTLTLFNVTTASQVITTTINGVDFNAGIGTSIFGGLTDGQSDANQNISGRTYTAFEFSDTTVVPEPSSFTLLLTGILSLFILRRKK